jgi:hypothetical protein
MYLLTEFEGQTEIYLAKVMAVSVQNDERLPKKAWPNSVNNKRYDQTNNFTHFHRTNEIRTLLMI